MIWWTKAWNPVIGCTKCSPACDNCYAEALHTQRHKALIAGKDIKAPCYSTPFAQVRRLPERLTQPLHWRKPQRVFVGNMGDLFHDAVVSFAFLDRIFATMARCPQHTFMLLTKRPELMHEYLTFNNRFENVWMCAKPNRIAHTWPLPNVWLGTTIWDQASADRAVPILLSTPAAKRFVSVEPMLGSVDLRAAYPEDFHYCSHCGWYGSDTEHCCTMCDSGTPYMPDTHGRCQNGHDGYRTECCPKCGEDGRYFAFDSVHEDSELKFAALDWVICGGETGPGARPMHPDWVRSLRDQCQAAEVPFFFKQWGEWAVGAEDGEHRAIYLTRDGQDLFGMEEDDFAQHFDCSEVMLRVGKAKAGRVLDGQEWSEVPHAR